MLSNNQYLGKYQANVSRLINAMPLQAASSQSTSLRLVDHAFIASRKYSFSPSGTTIFPLMYRVASVHTTEIVSAREIVKRAQKMEKSRERSAELLNTLRKKRLEGLAHPKPHLTPEERVLKRIEWLPSIKKLVIFYWVQVKSKRELTPVQKFTILECIAKYFSKDTQMRDVFLVQEMQQRFFKMLMQDIRANLNAYDAHQLYKVVFYMAKLCVTDPVVYKHLEKGLLHCDLGEYSTKELSQICWAFAKYCHDVDEIFHALDKEIFLRDLSEFTSAELCSIVWSFAEYGIPDTRQFYKVLGNEILTRNISQFEPWMLSSFSFAYSKLESLSGKVFKMVEEELFQRGELKPFGTNDLVMMVLAFARTGRLTPKLFRKLEVVMVKRRDYTETVTTEHLQEVYDLLKDGKFRLAEVKKMIERLLYPEKINSIFDVLYRPRRAWKEKVLHQSLFKAY